MNQAVLRLVGKEDGDKQKALEAALANIDRAFGKGSVMKLGERAARSPRSNRSPPAPWASTWRSGSAACPRGG